MTTRAGIGGSPVSDKWPYPPVVLIGQMCAFQESKRGILIVGIPQQRWAADANFQQRGYCLWL